MEHLPPVSSPYSPVNIPYIGDIDYDNLDFSTYHRRRGYDIDHILEGDFSGSSAAEIATFLQTWLYFGMLHEILNLEVKTEDFVRVDGSGKKWLTTKDLPMFLQNFKAQVEKERAQDNKVELFQTRNIKIRNCLSFSLMIWRGVLALDNNPLSDEISFAIHVLANTLQVGMTEICGLGLGTQYPEGIPAQEGYRVVPWEADRHWRITPNSFTKQRLVAQGWCPIVVEQIKQNFNILGQYYVSLFGPPMRKLNHSGCTLDSPDCEGFKSYIGGQTAHIIDGCDCKNIHVDQEILGAILEKDEIPVLYYDESAHKVEVIGFKPESDVEYTAISHVWTDGWGNPTENSLSSCRLEKLIRWIAATYTLPDFDAKRRLRRPADSHVQSSSGTWERADDFSFPLLNSSWPPAPRTGKLYFWMDTLCVPRYPDNLHNKAVMQMRHVYSEAERVLVLDAELIKSTAVATYEEINMRIQVSRWIRRLWTLQEAALPKRYLNLPVQVVQKSAKFHRLLFQFAEQSIILSTGSRRWHERQIDLHRNYWNSIGWDCFTSFSLYQTIADPGFRINLIWKELLMNRSVSVASDEPICGAIMMNFDLRYLTESPDVHERMKRFWEMHQSMIPIPILFVPGPRLSIPGYTWAPASLLHCAKSGPGMSHLAAITPYQPPQNATPKVPAPTQCLRMKLPALKSFLVGCPKEAVTFAFRCRLDGREYFIRKPPGSHNADLSALDLLDRQLAVIIEMVPREDDDGMGLFDGSRAGLVSIVNKDEDSWTAEYLRLVSVVQIGSTFHRYPREPYSSSELREIDAEPVAAS